jgi:hypothetical protein
LVLHAWPECFRLFRIVTVPDSARNAPLKSIRYPDSVGMDILKGAGNLIQLDESKASVESLLRIFEPLTIKQ